MNFIKKWLGIDHIEQRIKEMQIEINELKAEQMIDKDLISRIGTIVAFKWKEKDPKKNPGPKPKKKKE